jgi:DNA-binding NarL/FixJ family response regulator
MKCRVLLVDDHPLLREGLRELLRPETDFEVCGEAGSIAAAASAIAELEPDVMVVDLTLGGEDGVDLVTLAAQRFPKLRILVLSMHDEALYAERLLQLGAHGYLMKHESAPVLLAALRKVAGGELYVSSGLSSRLLGKVAANRDHGHHSGGLTDRELEVLTAIAKGLGTQEIAAALQMSAKTVDSHRRNIREKLGLRNATDLVRYAVRWAGENTTAPRPE